MSGMILTVDIGNTTVSLCGVERAAEKTYRVVFSARIDTLKDKGRDFYWDAMYQKLAENGIAPDCFEGAVLSCVVPELLDPIRAAAAALLGKEPLLISSDSCLGFSAEVKNLRQVGLDRLADAAWAAEHYPLPIVTVDMGTATTFNVIDKKKVFRGGVIAAGLATSLNALSARASQLPELRLRTPEHVIGKDTAECMLSGAVVGAAAMIDGIVFRIEQELGEDVTLLITGGLAPFAAPLCRHGHIYDPDLLPKGLALLYDRNKQL